MVYSYDDYTSTIKTNELLAHTTIWMTLKIIVLSKRIREKNTYYIPFVKILGDIY